ncbi:MAG: GNAT family N-acetyltransferase, partial [Gemmatimonadaceae bacterium]
MSAGITVRLATSQDAEWISATLRDAFAEFEALYTPAGFRATTPTASEIEGRFAEGPIWVAESDGKVVGTVSAVPRGGAELYIRSMAVRPSAQGQRLAASLLHTVEAFAADHHYRRLVLSTTPFLLRAIQLYQA